MYKYIYLFINKKISWLNSTFLNLRMKRIKKLSLLTLNNITNKTDDEEEELEREE